MSDMKVLIQQVTGKNFVLNVHPSDTVMETKQKIQGQTDISPANLRLLCGQDYLTEPNKSLASYGVKNESTILLVPRGATVKNVDQNREL